MSKNSNQDKLGKKNYVATVKCEEMGAQNKQCRNKQF